MSSAYDSNAAGEIVRSSILLIVSATALGPLAARSRGHSSRMNDESKTIHVTGSFKDVARP